MRYRYATDGDGTIVDVLTVTRDQPGPWLCVGCNQPLSAKIKGTHRVPHFAHRTRQTCSGETYLHRVAKSVFAATYRGCLATGRPYLIDLLQPHVCRRYESILPQPCDLGCVAVTYDLTRYFDRLSVETHDGAFVPDVLVWSSRTPEERVYIEIAVTHTVSDAKRESAHRIIEIPIATDADIGVIQRCHLTETDAVFLNFTRQDVLWMDPECPCDAQRWLVFVVYRSGRAWLGTATMTRIATRLADERILYRERIAPADARQDLGALFQAAVVRAFRAGVPVRNCVLCRFAEPHRRRTATDPPFFCHWFDHTCGSNTAADCPQFTPSCV